MSQTTYPSYHFLTGYTFQHPTPPPFAHILVEGCSCFFFFVGSSLSSACLPVGTDTQDYKRTPWINFSPKNVDKATWENIFGPIGFGTATQEPVILSRLGPLDPTVTHRQNLNSNCDSRRSALPRWP